MTFEEYVAVDRLVEFREVDVCHIVMFACWYS